MTVFQHKLHTTRANYESIQFFYENIEQAPQPGKNLFLVYIIDPDGIVFETEDDAFNAGLGLLRELSDEGELDGDVDEYTIDTFSIPITELTVEVLEDSELEHLIPAIVE